MATAALTATDVRLRDAVIRELDWDSEVDDSAIGVSAKDGVVTLTGLIDSYAGKLCAERVAQRVRGVRAVANDVIVRLKVDVTDPDIAAAAALALTGSSHQTRSIDAGRHAGGAVADTQSVDDARVHAVRRRAESQSRA